ncbi:hypothetical protein CSPX01_09905 [Colletotrichum filicis]|nr:hypothetical protein CSPX01_09905 [Colletotrichum filicis]
MASTYNQPFRLIGRSKPLRPRCGLPQTRNVPLHVRSSQEVHHTPGRPKSLDERNKHLMRVENRTSCGNTKSGKKDTEPPLGEEHQKGTPVKQRRFL